MCPWENWKATGLYFCEEPLCAWVKQPGNSYSNGFFLLVAWLLWRRWRKTHPLLAEQLILVSILIAVGSFFLHASLTFAGEVADLTGMFFLAARLLLWNFERYLRKPVAYPKTTFWTLSLLPTALMLAFGSVGIVLFQLQIATLVLLEAAMWRRGDKIDYRRAITTALIFGVAYGLWWLDVLHGWCNPNNHWVSGHVLWHFLTAASLLQIAEFYSQFTSQAKRNRLLLS